MIRRRSLLLAAPALLLPSKALAIGGLPAHNVSASTFFPIDALINAATAAYSTRKLRDAYAGSALQITRASDSTTQDIGFVSGNLDTASLLTFCAATNGTVTKWYDQSPNGRDLNTKPTSTFFPRMVTSGAVITTINGRSALTFTHSRTEAIELTGGADYFSSTNGTAFAICTASTNTTSSVDQWKNGAVFCDFSNGKWGLVFAQTTLAGAPCVDMFYKTNGGTPGASATFDDITKTYTFGSSSASTIAMRFDLAASPTKNLYLNGGTPATSTNNLLNSGTGVLCVGGGVLGPSNSSTFDGAICELYFFNTTLSTANSNLLGNNAAAYWGTAWSNIT